MLLFLACLSLAINNHKLVVIVLITSELMTIRIYRRLICDWFLLSSRDIEIYVGLRCLNPSAITRLIYLLALSGVITVDTQVA